MNPSPTSTAGLPLGFGEPGQTAAIAHGVGAWFSYNGDECDFSELIVHSHDQRRVLAVTSFMLRVCDVERLDVKRVAVSFSGWCRLVTTCGCTLEQHKTHGNECEPRCSRPELPPCSPEPVYAWMVEEVDKPDEPGMLPYTRVEISYY